MEPPTPSNWSPQTTVLALVLAVTVVTAAYSTPVLAQDDTEPTATFDTDGDVIVLETGPEQPISGTTSLDNGTPVTLRMRSVDSSNPFLRSTQVTVDENGEFTAVFDTTGIVPENETVKFTVTLSTENNGRLAEAEGVIVGDNAEYTTETTSTTSTTTTTTTTATSTPTTAATAPGFGALVAILGAVLTGGLLALQLD